MILSLRNRFSAADLEAEDGGQGEFLAQVHLPALRIWPQNSEAVPALGRACASSQGLAPPSALLPSPASAASQQL